MTNDELRNHPEYKVCMDKITAYPVGFKFTMNWDRIPAAKANALKIILRDACQMGLIEQIATGVGLDLRVHDETYIRI